MSARSHISRYYVVRCPYYQHEQNTVLYPGIYILEEQPLTVVGKFCSEALGGHVQKYFILPRDLRKHIHKMVMFALIWEERRLSFE